MKLLVSPRFLTSLYGRMKKTTSTDFFDRTQKNKTTSP